MYGTHTPDEARSVGLVKACVLQKIYSVLEKISHKYIIQTEWETYMPSTKLVFWPGLNLFIWNFILIVISYTHSWHAYHNVPMQCDTRCTHSCHPEYLQLKPPSTLNTLPGTFEALHHHLQQAHVHKHFLHSISQPKWHVYHNSGMNHDLKHSHSCHSECLESKLILSLNTFPGTLEAFYHLQQTLVHIHSFNTVLPYTTHISFYI